MVKNISRGKEEFEAELSITGSINHMNLARIWVFLLRKVTQAIGM